MRQLILPTESMLQSITNKSNDSDHSCLASHGIVAVNIGVVKVCKSLWKRVLDSLSVTAPVIQASK